MDETEDGLDRDRRHSRLVSRPERHHLTRRVAVEITEFCDGDRIVKAVEDLCRTRFNIQHSTVQLVYNPSEVAPDCGAPPQND